jgi:transposase
MNTHHHPSRDLSQTELEKRRLSAVKYFNTQSNYWIGKKLNVSREAVGQWKRKWEADGVTGLTHGTYGRKSKLTPTQEKIIQKDILKGAEESGYSGDFWTLSRITDHIKKKTGVQYQDRSVWHTLERFGFSCQVPERRARERDEKAIQTWVTTTWPAIKKGV